MSHQQSPSSSTTPPPQKFSRYRSVRHTTPLEPPPPPIVPLPKEKTDMQRTKSMARYRRPGPKVGIPVQDGTPAIPNAQARNGIGERERVPMRAITDPAKAQSASQREGLTSEALRESTRRRQPETENERLRRKVREFQEREAARAAEQNTFAREKEEKDKAYQAQLQKENAERELRRKRSKEQGLRRQREEVEEVRLNPEDMLEEQKKTDLKRLQKELDVAAPAVSPPTPAKSPKFGFFSRKSGNLKDTPPDVDVPVPKVKEATKQNILARSPQKKVERPTQGPKIVVEVAPHIQQGGGGIVPQTDAPISASNAGERRVLVRCKQSSVNLPVNPETTPKDLIYSAANFMTQNIIPSTAILIESYNQLGLERRVRRYEHIRDVMNSWDRDTQNAFQLENSDSPQFDKDLELSGVPKEVPADVTVYIYHSQKPGTWVKRYITLLSTGQIFIHKKPDAKIGDKHATRICDLSDFDIYSVTPQQLRKVLKAPKKHCFAIKSQQKTAVFLSTENFVHFFSTDDHALAEKWYAAVQSWRSWYLVTKKGEGGTKSNTSQTTKTKTATSLLSEKEDDTPYTIGTFSGLGLDENFRSGSSSGDYNSDEDDRPRQVPFHMRISMIISAEARRTAKRHPPIVNYRVPPPDPSPTEGEFASSGLLGRSYTVRKAQADSKNASSQQPFTEGPNLLNRETTRDTTRTTSLNSQSNSKSMSLTRTHSRSNSKATKPGPPKPLLDFTPTFKEAPQWDKTGKGHGVVPVKGVPLVEVATTPDNPLDMGNVGGTVFRRDAGNGTRPVTRGGSGDGAFVKGGLVGGNGKGESLLNRGRVRYD